MRRKGGFLRAMGRVVAFIFVLGVLGIMAFVWVGLSLTAPGPLTDKKIVQIPRGDDRAAMAAFLQEQGVISGTRLFSATAAIDEQLRHVHLKTGEYEFAAGASIADVIAALSRGDFVKYKITIPEGWTSQMVVNRLNDQEELDGPVSAVPAEGSLLPETYIVTRGYPRDKLLADMASAQDKLMEGEVARLSPEGVIKTKTELLTLASIVEKETGVADERPLVAAVFLNRLKQHMRLQSDPTVIYGIVGGKGKLDHPITRDELDGETAYNTYVIDGLPPGPIANPGKAAIEAVLNPANVSYIYFVANGSGGHAFASTLDEHNANVKKWRALSGTADAAGASKTAPLSTVVAPPVQSPAPKLPKPPVKKIITP